MNLLFVLPEGIQIEKRPWTKRTGEFHPKVGPAHMCANGYMRSGWSFTAPLKLKAINPLGAPILR